MIVDTKIPKYEGCKTWQSDPCIACPQTDENSQHRARMTSLKESTARLKAHFDGQTSPSAITEADALLRSATKRLQAIR
jgi:hypothetical protein